MYRAFLPTYNVRNCVRTRNCFARRIIVFAALLSLLSLPNSVRAAGETASTIYFYSPETNINNYSLLKSEFDSYLSGHGQYQFQPFSKQDDFEAFVKGKGNCVLLVSSWHYRAMKDVLPMEPVLVGTINEVSTQKRILSVTRRVSDLESLRGRKVASAGSEDYTRTVLADMLGEERADLVASFKILVVPKDIDALMAVSFGMAKAALTTESSLGKLRRSNPKQHGLLMQLADSDGILLPVVAAPRGTDASVQGLLTVMEGMGKQSAGASCLKMIGLDQLKRIEDSERRILQQ